MRTRDEYLQINNSFQKICIYRIGNHAGFFSEINNMIIAMIYCLENSYRFEIYSTNTMYCNDIWQDFFYPFTQHATNPFHIKNNSREFRKIKLTDFNPQQDAQILEYLNSTFSGQDEIFLTQNVWTFIRNPRIFNPQHRVNKPFISGNTIHVAYQLVQSIWNYKPHIRKRIDDIKRSVKVETPYAGFHIRRGDKFREKDFTPIESYFNKLNQITKRDDYPVFIATDDQRIIGEIKDVYPNRRIYHFHLPQNKGFDMDNFQPLNKQQQADSIIQLLAEVEMLVEANIFVGTFTSNVGMFVGMARDGREIYGVDTNGWIVW